MKTFRRSLLIAILLGSLGVWLWLVWLRQSYEQPYCLVERGLYIGSAVNKPPAGTRAVVNLCGGKDPYEVEASLWEPVFEGGEAPNLQWLRRVVEFIAAQRAVGRPTYVHCLAGMNRSGAVVTAYLMQEHGWGRDEALAYLQKRRPVVQPNSTLMRLLAEWEETLNTTSKDDWPFDQPRNCATLTMRQILDGTEPILLVSHNADDDGWQFIGTSDATEADARVVSLEEIVHLDPTVLDVANLPPGWQAVRDKVGGAWTRRERP